MTGFVVSSYTLPMQLTRVTRKFQVTIPRAVRKAAGIRLGDLMEVKPSKEGILFRRKAIVDYDPAVEKALAEAEADVKAGRVSGPFDSAEEVMNALNEYKRKRLAGRVGRSKKPTPGAAKQRRAHARAALG